MIGFFIGVIIGGVLGITVMAMLNMAAADDKSHGR